MSKATMRITLFIPVLNEITGLRAIMPRIQKHWVDEVVIIDAGSTDGSREFLESLGYAVVTQRSKGVRGAFWEAFELATGDVIIPFSPDNNSVPEDIPRLIDKVNEGYDMVIASRYLGGITSEDDDGPSRFANWCFTALINLLFRASYTDAIGMYKAFKTRHLYELGIDRHKSEHSEILLTCRAPRYGLRVTEIASPEPPRLGPPGSRAHPGRFGKHKAAILILKQILRDYFFYWPQKRA